MNQPMGVESNNKTTSKTTSKKKNTGSGTGSSAGSQSSAAASDGYAIYWAYLQELQAREQAARDAAYNAAAAQQRANLAYAQNQVNAAADQALQEAYINRMLSLRGLNQQLSAQGLTGGAAESTLAGLYNNYGNARAQLESERTAQQASLLNTYQNNMAQLAAERAGGAASALQELVPQLAKLYASNGLDLLSLVQGASSASRTTVRRTARTAGEEETNPTPPCNETQKPGHPHTAGGPVFCLRGAGKGLVRPTDRRPQAQMAL